MRAPWKAQEQIMTGPTGQKTSTRASRRDFLLYLGPSLMVSLAYMDPGNYGTDLAAGRLQVRARLGRLACFGDGDATTVSFWKAWNRFGPLSTRNGKEVASTEGVCGPLLARG